MRTRGRLKSALFPHTMRVSCSTQLDWSRDIHCRWWNLSSGAQLCPCLLSCDGCHVRGTNCRTKRLSLFGSFVPRAFCGRCFLCSAGQCVAVADRLFGPESPQTCIQQLGSSVCPRFWRYRSWSTQWLLGSLPLLVAFFLPVCLEISVGAADHWHVHMYRVVK